MAERKKDFMELIDERHEVLSEVKRLLESGPSDAAQKRIIELLKKNDSRRRELLELLYSLPIKDMDDELKEYYETLIDYIQLVDGEREEEIIDMAVDYAERHSGVLQDNIGWLRKQSDKARDYREKASKIMK